MVEHLVSKPSEMSANAWLAKIKRTANLNPRLDEHGFNLNGLPALRVRYRNPSDGGYEMESVFVVSGTQTFEIEFSSEGKGMHLEKSENYPIFLQMIKTFRVKP